MAFIPTGRQEVWNPGIPGGLAAAYAAQNYTVHSTLIPSGGDDRVALQALIDAAGAAASAGNGKIVMLPAGIVRLSDYVQIKSSYVLVRGAGSTGAGRTRVQYTSAASQIFLVGGLSSDHQHFVPISSGYTEGSNALVFGSAGAIAAYSIGDIVNIVQNDTGNPDTRLVQGNASWDKISDATEPGTNPWPGSWASLGHLARITNKVGATITLDKNLKYTFTAACTPHIAHIKGTNSGVPEVVRYSGVENMYIERLIGNENNLASVIQIAESERCWIKNVEVYKGVGRMLKLTKSYECHIQSCDAHHGWKYDSGGIAYGCTIGLYVTDSIIEDCFFRYFNGGIVLEMCGPGNVIVDTDSRQGWLDTIGGRGLQHGGIHTHASYVYKFLVEQCQMPHFEADDFHGSSFRGTLFRNYMTTLNEE